MIMMTKRLKGDWRVPWRGTDSHSTHWQADATWVGFFQLSSGEGEAPALDGLPCCEPL